MPLAARRMGRAGVIGPRPVARTAATVGTVAVVAHGSTGVQIGEKTDVTTGATGETTVGTGAEPTSARAALDCDRDRAAGSTRRWRSSRSSGAPLSSWWTHYVNRRMARGR
jgi:hypothetical protein